MTYKCAHCGYESEDRTEFVEAGEVADYLGVEPDSLICSDCYETERDYLDFDEGIF